MPAVSVLRGQGPDAWPGLLAALVAVWCVVAAPLLFRRGLRRYESAGD